MITAKGLKPASQSQQSQSTHEDYVETEQPKRRIIPLAFLLFLTGCAAYLKSFLPVKIEAREAQQASKHDDAEQSDPRPDDELSAVTDEEVATARRPSYQLVRQRGPDPACSGERRAFERWLSVH